MHGANALSVNKVRAFELPTPQNTNEPLESDCVQKSPDTTVAIEFCRAPYRNDGVNSQLDAQARSGSQEVKNEAKLRLGNETTGTTSEHSDGRKVEVTQA